MITTSSCSRRPRRIISIRRAGDAEDVGNGVGVQGVGRTGMKQGRGRKGGGGGELFGLFPA
jgi:hypothetical protein